VRSSISLVEPGARKLASEAPPVFGSPPGPPTLQAPNYVESEKRDEILEPLVVEERPSACELVVTDLAAHFSSRSPLKLCSRSACSAVPTHWASIGGSVGEVRGYLTSCGTPHELGVLNWPCIRDPAQT
jgi:hypothetical protein